MQNGNKYKTVLVPVDCSEQSFETVRYVGKIMKPGRAKITLFHVVSPVSKSYLDFESDPPAGKRAVLNQAPKEVIEKFLEKASATLHQQGIHPKNVKRVVQARRRGVARDILSETFRGYDAVAIGRGPHKAIKNQIMGGTANRIVNNIYNTPVWLVGQCSDPGSILIAMDGSTGAMRAFTYAKKMLLRESSEILLYSVTRSLDNHSSETDQQGSTEAEMKSRFTECIAHLKQTGGDAIRVRSKIEIGLPSRAEGIVNEARQGGYATIIMGRRGLSDVRQYAMGQVCQKALTMATDRAVWIVN
jgi:nucleotide-binding universal stress UspA family protein